MPQIHPTAVVDPTAKLAEDVVIGPHCVVEHDVEIGAGTRLLANAFIGCYTTMGENNVVYPFASIGSDPEDYGFDGSVSYTKIGNNNRFREGVTVNRATHEGASSIRGAYLDLLGASAGVIGFISGLGELIGYSMRYVFGKWVDWADFFLWLFPLCLFRCGSHDI